MNGQNSCLLPLSFSWLFLGDPCVQEYGDVARGIFCLIVLTVMAIDHADATHKKSFGRYFYVVGWGEGVKWHILCP